MSTWVITGANRGIGLELARQLTARGDTVIGGVRDPDRADALRELGARVERLDVADPASVEAFGRALGGAAVDGLINNAGVGGHARGIAELAADELARVYAVNAIGPMMVVRALLPALRAGLGKKIVHITSLMGSVGDNASGGAYAYRASKAALNMLNKSLSLELRRDGFTCLVLNPGWVQTDMGGPSANLPPYDSVRGMLAVVDAATPAITGRFFHYDGRELPW